MYEPFGGTSRWADIDGPVHYLDFGGSPDTPSMVLVHGLGGSHANWLAVGADLARSARVLAVDLAGFGRTPPLGRGSTVAANRKLLGRFIDAVVGEPAVLVGNSMGGSISILQAAAEPEATSGLVLVAPAVPRAVLAPMDTTVARNFAMHAIPGVGSAWLRRRFMRLGVEGMARDTLELCCVDADRVRTEVFDAGVALRREQIAMPWLRQSFLDASRSLMATLLRSWAFDAQVESITAPTLVIYGAEDRLVPEANIERLRGVRPDWDYELLRDVGHVPQLEVPELFLDLVGAWLARLPAATGSAG